MRSIMQFDKSCYICGRRDQLERHHAIHGTAGRAKAEPLGLWVWLCPEHHRTGPGAAHGNATTDLTMKKLAQIAYEKHHTRAEWMKEIGRNYLDT